MTTFLTTQEMQHLLNVDRSTVYRMAEDGRLPGVKVGRQWRFPADKIAAQLGLSPAGLPGSATSATSAPSNPSNPPNPSNLPSEAAADADVADDSGTADVGDGPLRLGGLLEPGVAQSIADLLGDLFGVMAVLTDLDGAPLTEVANPCGYYEVVATRPAAAAACVQGWRQLAAEPHVAPRFVPSHLGFLCARTFVWVDLKPVGMLIVGGVTPPSWPPAAAHLEAIATEVGVPVEELAAHSHETWHVTPERQRWILQLLPQFADLVSQLARTRNQLLARFAAIAQLAAPTPSPNPPRKEAS